MALFGVNFILQKFCQCKKNDKYQVWEPNSFTEIKVCHFSRGTVPRISNWCQNVMHFKLVLVYNISQLDQFLPACRQPEREPRCQIGLFIIQCFLIFNFYCQNIKRFIRGKRIVFWWPNTNTNIIRFSKNDRTRMQISFGFPKTAKYEYKYYLATKKRPNTNTNIIRLSKNDRIWIQILFNSLKMTEYEHEYYLTF